MRDFFDPAPEEQVIVLVDGLMLRKVERLIESCEHCNPDGAEIPFDNILGSRHPFTTERDGLHSRSAGKVPELQTCSVRENADRTRA